jgi:hypothetical protein
MQLSIIWMHFSYLRLLAALYRKILPYFVYHLALRYTFLVASLTIILIYQGDGRNDDKTFKKSLANERASGANGHKIDDRQPDFR